MIVLLAVVDPVSELSSEYESVPTARRGVRASIRDREPEDVDSGPAPCDEETTVGVICGSASACRERVSACTTCRPHIHQGDHPSLRRQLRVARIRQDDVIGLAVFEEQLPPAQKKRQTPEQVSERV